MVFARETEVLRCTPDLRARATLEGRSCTLAEVCIGVCILLVAFSCDDV